MSNKKDETASFVLRFTQKIFQSEAGEPQVQWRGNIRHVQGGEEQRFSEFEEVVQFIQGKLADLTIQAMGDKSPDEQKGILAKSFDLWKKMASTAPKVVLDTIKDPKRQVAQFQDQIQDQLNQFKVDFGDKIDIDSWMASSKSNNKELMKMMEKMSKEIQSLNKKVDKLSKKLKKD